MNGLLKTTGIMLLLLLALGAGYAGYSGSNNQTTDLIAQIQARLGSGDTPVANPMPTPPPTVPVERGGVEETIIAPGQLAGTKEQILPAGVGGTIAELHARPGDRVKAGDVLAQIDRRPYEEALSLAQLKLSLAQEELARQIANAELAVQSAATGVASAQAGYPSLTAAQIRVQQAQQSLTDAQAAYNKALDPGRDWELNDPYRAETLKAEREAAPRQVQMAEDSLSIAQAELASVQNQSWANSQSVNGAEIGVAKAQAELDALRANGVNPLLQWEVNKAQADLDATTITAPFAGVVLEVGVRVGQNVGAGQMLLLLADVQQGEVLASVIEEDLPLVRVGQRVELYFDAAPDSTIAGTVSRIVPQRTGTERPLYAVYITVDDLPETLLPGMTADAIIIIQRQEDVLRLPRTLIRAGSDDTATVQVWNDRAAEPRTIKIGLRGDTYVEILSGLTEGELVLGQ
ncbi:MAG: efflux RND transporter periplasmic adaptor subunit [Chloroflexi bacterium]|nr:efflux RND transporter periplasmic adaptor subunit [Chloroflexota bacterium]MBP7042897.1 efflux RND transporter periplasmic adaptor subunit [Chloroflexota bacterium]